MRNISTLKHVNMTGWIAILSIALIAGIFIVQTADAVVTLKLSDGSTIIEVADGGAGDTLTEAGAVGYDGALGVFDLNLSAYGILSGTMSTPSMSFGSVLISSGAGTLDIWLSETGFGPSTGFIETTVSGTTGGTVQFSVYQGTDLFDETNQIASIGSISGSDTGGSFVNLSDYSLTLKASVSHGSGIKSTSISTFDVNVVPEPVSSLLFIAGGATLGFTRLRKKLSK